MTTANSRSRSFPLHGFDNDKAAEKRTLRPGQSILRIIESIIPTIIRLR